MSARWTVQWEPERPVVVDAETNRPVFWGGRETMAAEAQIAAAAPELYQALASLVESIRTDLDLTSRCPVGVAAAVEEAAMVLRRAQGCGR